MGSIVFIYSGVINNHIWTDFLVNAKLDAVQYIEGNLEIIMEKYVKEIPHTEVSLLTFQ